MRGFLGSVLGLAACATGAAQRTALPAYSPRPIEGGTIRSRGDSAMRGAMTALEQAFRTYHPEISFEDTLLGTATSMAGIITGTSDLSLMGRPATVNEVIGFEWVFRVKPLGIQVANGNLQGEGKTPALAVFVSRSNPVQQLSMAQLALILGCPANPKAPVTWAAAGAGGIWGKRRIHAYLYDDQTGTGAFLLQAIQGTKDCWNWEMVREFKDTTRRDGSAYPAAQQIVDALKRDPGGLAISTLAYAGPEIKALPLAGAGLAVPLTPETITSSSYPLARGVYIYIHRDQNKPVDAKVDEFLRFILSREGQQAVVEDSGYLPLGAPFVLQEREALR